MYSITFLKSGKISEFWNIWLQCLWIKYCGLIYKKHLKQCLAQGITYYYYYQLSHKARWCTFILFFLELIIALLFCLLSFNVSVANFLHTNYRKYPFKIFKHIRYKYTKLKVYIFIGLLVQYIPSFIVSHPPAKCKFLRTDTWPILFLLYLQCLD